MSRPKKAFLPVDKDINVPPAVKAAAARSAEIYSQVYQTEPPAEPPAEPAATPEPAPAPTSEPATVTPEVTPQPAAAAPQDWEHKLRSEIGRVERAKRIIDEQNERIANLEQTLAALSASAPAPTPAAVSAASLVTEQDMDQWGPDFFGAVERKASELLTPLKAQFEGQIQELTERLQNVGGVIAHDARSRMFQDLDTAVPNWKEINQNERFLNWLGLPDMYSGAIRDALLQKAFAANDAPRVIAFFKGFLSEEAATAPLSAEPAPKTPAPAAEPRIPLETFAAPGRAKTAAAHTPAPAEKPIIHRSDITKFYTDCAAGKYRGREEEKRQAEAELQAAVREGRVK